MSHCKMWCILSLGIPPCGRSDSYRDALAEGGWGNVIDLRKRVSPEGVALL
jgi:hypothetical protein